MTKHKKHVLLFTLVASLVAISFFTWLNRPKPIAVIFADVATGEVQRTVTNTRAGTLQACRRAKLFPSFGGQIANLPVKEGDQVVQGQILFEIWNDDLLAQLDLAKSEYQSTKARAKEACVQAEVAEKDANRLKKLKKKGLASDENTDKAIGLAKSTRAACEAVQSTINVAQSRIEVAEATLKRTRLTAPFAGTIAEVNGELGEYVTPSPVGIPTPPAVDLIDTRCLYVTAPIDEVDAPEIRPGMIARISMDAFGKAFFEAKVRRVAPYVLDKEKQARTVEIEVGILDSQRKPNMLPGYSADIEVILDSHQDVLRIPTEAILEGQKVYLYDAEDGSISQQAIKIGLSNWKFTEVLQGLEPGMKIVRTIDREGLSDGAYVIAEKSGTKTSSQ